MRYSYTMLSETLLEEDREMAQQLRSALAAFAEDPGSSPSTHTGQLIIACSSGSRTSDISSEGTGTH